MHMCPVCGYDQLRRPARDFIICPSCGTEFDYHDATTSHEELRARWLRRGAAWTSRVVQPPQGWNAYDQLVRARLISPQTTLNATSHVSGDLVFRIFVVGQSAKLIPPIGIHLEDAQEENVDLLVHA